MWSIIWNYWWCSSGHEQLLELCFWKFNRAAMVGCVFKFFGWLMKNAGQHGIYLVDVMGGEAAFVFLHFLFLIFWGIIVCWRIGQTWFLFLPQSIGGWLWVWGLHGREVYCIGWKNFRMGRWKTDENICYEDLWFYEIL